MAFKPGDRVKWAHSEPSADPNELHGKIIEINYVYRVKWDDGSIDDDVDEDDLERDTGGMD